MLGTRQLNLSPTFAGLISCQGLAYLALSSLRISFAALGCWGFFSGLDVNAPLVCTLPRSVLAKSVCAPASLDWLSAVRLSVLPETLANTRVQRRSPALRNQVITSSCLSRFHLSVTLRGFFFFSSYS